MTTHDHEFLGIEPRIVGGNITDPNLYPFFCILQAAMTLNGHWF